MFRIGLICFGLFFGSSNSCFEQSSKIDDSVEPKLKYDLRIGDKTVTVTAGETVKVDGEFTNPTIQLRPGKFRIFPYAGVSFSYPRGFVFEADLSDPEAKNWMLTGNSCVIMLFHMNAKTSTDQFAAEMIGQFGAENATISDSNLIIKLGSHKLPGTKLDVSIATQKLVLEILELPTNNDQTKLLVIQDSLDADGSRSTEAATTIAKINDTFKLHNRTKR